MCPLDRGRRRATPARSRVGGLITSRLDSLPRPEARCTVASKCFLPGRRRHDVACRKEHHVVAEAFVIGVDSRAATHSLALVSAAAGDVVDEVVFPNTSPSHDRALKWIIRRVAVLTSRSASQAKSTYSETASGLPMTLVSFGLRLASCRVRCDCALDPPGRGWPLVMSKSPDSA
jgi:hypothetical protein